MKVYIAGQISGLDYREAFENFDIVEKRLREIGVTEILNPMREVDPTLNWNQQMEICLSELRKCDLVVFQSNWKESVGARREFEEASKHYIHIRYDRNIDYDDIERVVMSTVDTID